MRAVLLALTLGLAAWPAAAAERLKVFTTFTVIADMARNVAGEAADVESLTKPGAEIHYYQPTPGDILRAQGADLILWNGLNLELWFDRFLRNLGDVPSAILSAGVEPIGIVEGPYEGKPNPHAWMSPEVGLIYVENIRKALAEADPANAEVYAAPPPIPSSSGRSPSRSAPSSLRCPRSDAGSSPPRGRSAISPATSGSTRPISGRSTPTSRARRNRSAR
jgi:ABC-type Zn uptake system ZnuABC Zn-binding protein ZnuA